MPLPLQMCAPPIDSHSRLPFPRASHSTLSGSKQGPCYQGQAAREAAVLWVPRPSFLPRHDHPSSSPTCVACCVAHARVCGPLRSIHVGVLVIIVKAAGAAILLLLLLIIILRVLQAGRQAGMGDGARSGGGGGCVVC